ERPTRDGGIVSIEADITALKRQELIIERSKAQFQSVVDEQTELICRFLPDKTLTLVNLPFASFYGKTPNSMIGTKLTGLLLEKGTQLLPGMMEPISKDNPVMEVEQEIDMPDGSRNWFWWRCRGFFNAAGNLTEYQCVGSNITTMKRQQEQLQQKEESLTQHIRDLEYSRRMLQEQGEQLVILADEYSIQKDRAEAANSAKSDFLSSMSHELRTPLNAILGFSQLLSNDPSEPLTAAQKDYVEQILKGGEHLLGLINEVLDLAKVESGKVSLSIEEVDPAEVIDQSLIMTYTQAENRNISIIDKTTDSDLPKVWADFTRFKQVLLNLLSNAVKYNKEGGEILLESSEVEDGLLRFSVTDTGRGIPKSKQKDIFQPFSRLGAEATDIEGTGIGLTITKQLVELMNGRIGFNSEQGKGSTFWMELPTVHEGVFDTDEIEMLEVDSHVLNSSVEFSDGSERTLLYVEDNPANLKLVERIVSKIPNIKMLSANNAERGLQIAMTHRPDVIILDINLPGMNGYEALERLHASEITSNIPVIALSASAMIKDVEKGTMAGFHTYLTKPIKIDEVINAIKSALLVQA
ncbi:MAG: ATP-binding protein, partial [Rhodospirillales bacterium]|nr:ATP-binding protein [Rhodospirillales bacterium]